MSEEIKTDNTETLKNALDRIAELEKEIKNLKLLHSYDVIVLKAKNNKAKEIIKGILPYITFTFDEETDSYLRKYYKQAENFIED